MHRDRNIQLLALAVMCVCLAASGVLAAFISGSLGRNRLVYQDSAEQGDPPEVAAGIAMGAFRGLFVNYLWIRANNLKEEGKYYEAIDLASAITKLQPRFPKVWTFHAWNLAYNISVATQTPQERWTWVRAGINLLRDKGIPANPNDLSLHKELAWIYLHKVQGVMDDAHVYYKQQHAREWTIVLGAPPRIPIEDRGKKSAAEIYVRDWLTPIAESPDTIEEVYAAQPAAREMVESLRAAGVELDSQFLEHVEGIKAVARVNEATGILPNIAQDPVFKVMTDPKFREAGPVVIRHVRKRVLIDEYRMEPDRMIRYTKKYGPLDWRHPAAHAVYWSARGVEEALLRITTDNRKDFDLVNTDRETIQAVQELFRTGTVYYDILRPDFYRTFPNTDYIDVYGSIIEELRGRSDFDDIKRTYGLYNAGYENFSRDVIRFLYRTGDKQKAQEYYSGLRTWPGLNRNNIFLSQELGVTLDEFVQNEIVKENRETSPTVALQEISGSLYAAYVSGLLVDDEKRFQGCLDYAKQFHTVYQQSQGFKTWLAGNQGRLGMPPFDVLASQALAQVITEVGLPQGPVMYKRAPNELRGRAYVLLEVSPLREEIDAMAKNGAPTFDNWFPPPGDPATVQMYRDQMLKPRGSNDPGTIVPK